MLSRRLGVTRDPPLSLRDVTHPVFEELARDMERDAGQLVLDLVTDYYARVRDGQGPVSTPLEPAAIAERFSEPLPTGLQTLGAVLERLAGDVLSDANQLMHPMYVGHQVAAPLPAAAWTDAIIGALNQSQAVWEMSPTATVVEHRVIRWMCDLAGFGPGSGGTFTSGGTEATFTALLAARAALMPDAWERGLPADLPVVVCGEHAHYAVSRAVAQLGLGLRRVVTIPSRDWRMDSRALREALDDLERTGTPVMALVATSGSTSTGSFDDLESIGSICEERGIWLHVDGAHGASALLSSKHRGLLRGIHRANSIAWDPHKMMLMPLSTGVLLVRDERQLELAFAQKAPYLFHSPVGERSWDQGPRSFMCSRRSEALKVWVALQRYGADGLAAIYDRMCEVTAAMASMISEREEFEVLHKPECNILCFRYRGYGGLTSDALDELNGELRARYNLSGRGWITTTILDGRRVLRVTVMNPRTTESHVREVLDGLAAEAERMGERRGRREVRR